MARNVGGTDAAIRLVVGILLVGVATALATRPLAAGIVALVAVVMFVTAYTHICPLYRLLGLDTSAKTPPAGPA